MDDLTKPANGTDRFRLLEGAVLIAVHVRVDVQTSNEERDAGLE